MTRGNSSPSPAGCLHGKEEMATERVAFVSVCVNLPVLQELHVDPVSFLEQQCDRVCCGVLGVGSRLIIRGKNYALFVLHQSHGSRQVMWVEEDENEVVYSFHRCCEDTWRDDLPD